MNITDLYTLYSKHYLVDTDTRSIRKNTLFFALKGSNFNGNSFAEDALKLGALFSIVDEEKFKTNSKIILVKNVLETLQELANFHRKQLNIPIIGLTGSNGKTTTKELINVVLSKKHQTTATKGNLNNHIGVPLTLLSMTPKTEIGIVEMGANNLKEIEFLCAIAEPDYGYITNFGKAHLEGFGGIDGVIEGKSELYKYLKNNDKNAFVNQEDLIQKEKSEGINSIFFNSNELKFLDANPNVKLQLNSENIQSNLIGKYNYTNIAAAITIGTYFGVNNDDIKEAVESYIPTNNRSQVIHKKNNKVLLDAYNANPTSMKAALDNFYLLKDKNKIVILGDMFELGETSRIEHQQITDLISNLGFDNVFFVGKHFLQSKTKNHQFRNFKSLKEYIIENPLKNKTILIKGSRGMALERILDFID